MTMRHIIPGTGIFVILILAIGCARQSPEDSLKAGLEYAQQGSWQKAIDAYTEALNGKPDWIDAYVNRGVARAALGDYPGAIKDYDAALRINPNDSDALTNRGLARHELKQYKEALLDYSAALAADETEVNAYRNRALTFRALGDLVSAVEDYGDAIRLEPDDVEVYRERAALHREQKDEDAAAVDDALAELTAAIVATPQNAVPHRERGLIFFELGEYVLALSDLDEAVRLAPEHADTYLARAHAWFIQGYSDKAIEDYTRALDRRVESAAEAYAGRANAYESIGNTVNAIADYSEAVRLNPADEDAAMQLSWILATYPDRQLRDGKRAVVLATRALALTDGRHWRSLDIMAAACAEAGEFSEARKYADRSLDLAPPDQIETVRGRLMLYRSDQPYHEGGQ
jgi:tetratricopeptide (TPR) repeat protein